MTETDEDLDLFAAGAASRQEEIDALRIGLQEEQVARAAVEAEWEDHMRTVHAPKPKRTRKATT